MPVKRWVKRHFDYVVDIGNVAAQTFALQVPLQINTRAPFVLRGRAVRPAWFSTNGNTATSYGSLAIRYTGPDQEYLSQNFIPWSPMAMAQGLGGCPVPTQSPMLYAPGSVILTDVWNFDTAAAFAVQVIYRGYELWPEGSVQAPSYPANFRAVPYTQVSTIKSLAVVDNGPNLNRFMQVGQVDQGSLLAGQTGQPADFVIRNLYQYFPVASGIIGTGQGNSTPSEVFIRIYDQQKLSYSNAPVHIDCFLGNYPFYLNNRAQENVFPRRGNNSGWNGTFPGLLTPEIYLPKNQILIYDVTRNDPATIQGVLNNTPQPMLIGWSGMKVLY